MLFAYFHRRPLLLKVIYLIALVIGVIGYVKMPRNMYPDVERPQVLVTTQLPGAAAQSVAQKISRPIEQELYGLRQVRDVQSLNKNEVSIVRAEFDYDKGLDAALLDVNNALSKIRAKLPSDALPSSVQPVGGFTKPVMVVTMSPKAGSAMGLTTLRLLAENDVRAAFVTRPGIANAEVFGGYEPIIRIDIDPFKLARYRISLAQLQDVVAKTNQDWPVGSFQGDKSNLTLSIPGESADIGKLRSLRLTSDVSLGDVANVNFSHADRLSAYHGNGKAGIAVALLRAPGAPVETAVQSAEQSLLALQAQFPMVNFEVSETQGDLIKVSNDSMVTVLLDAVLFTGIVMLVFLGNWRAVATALLGIPLVFLITLAILWLTGKELNILVMTGIVLALGMLVDDAVVVLENIERHLKEGRKSVDEAVRVGTQEVLFPIFIGTIATVAVIGPLMFVGDFPQQIFKHLILTVIIAVFVSYFVSVTFIPQACAFWYRHGIPPASPIERTLGRLYARCLKPGAALYVGALKWGLAGSLSRRLLLLIPAFALLVLSMKTIVPIIGKEAMPPMDTGDVRIHVRFGSGESVAAAETKLRQFEARLVKDPRVKRVSTALGSEPGVVSMGSGQLPAEATINIAYVTRFDRTQTSWQLADDLRDQIAALPGVTTVDVFDSGATALASVKAPVDLQLAADDWRLLPHAAQRVKDALGRVEGMTSVSTSWDGYASEISLRLDEDKLRAHGLTLATVYGQLPLKALQLSAFSRLSAATALPIKAYLIEPYRSNPHSLALLPIPLPDGGAIPLGELGNFVQQPGVSLITTGGLRYTLDVLGYRDTAPISHLSERAQSAARDVLPAGVTMVEKGDNEAGEHAMRRMMMGLALGVLLLFSVLVPAYGSVALGLLSLLILPLSMIGALWALLAFDKALGMPALLGIILLFSIIIKNAILMVDAIRQRRDAGDDATSAAIASVQLRYRPILMTAFGTIAGLIPIALQRAVGLERMSPLAVAAIGGLVVGTVLSMLYLPLLYVWVTDRMTRQALLRPNLSPVQ